KIVEIFNSNGSPYVLSSTANASVVPETKSSFSIASSNDAYMLPSTYGSMYPAAHVMPTSGNPSEVDRTLILSLYCSLLNTSKTMETPSFSASKSSMISFTTLLCCAELPSGQRCINSTVLSPELDSLEPLPSPSPPQAANNKPVTNNTAINVTAFLKLIC